ncbi:MAG: ketol-acid reductoisomerase [Pseudomonadota bacterium]
MARRSVGADQGRTGSVPLPILYEKAVDRRVLDGRRVAILGFGAQGKAHALNVRDSGVDVVVGLRRGSASVAAAEALDLPVQDVDAAVRDADLVMLLVPDQVQPALYDTAIKPNLRPNGTLLFAHGYNVRFDRIRARADIDVVLVAPMGIGEQVRATYIDGGGVPGLIAVAQDASGEARARALAYASANGHARAGMIETSFAEETETDLFAEQVVLCGGITHLVNAAFETLVEAGYNPDIAYFCCLHELKLIADMMHIKGIAGMRRSASDIAEFGDYTRGPRIVDHRTRNEMKAILKEIQSGEFAEEMDFEFKNNRPVLRSRRGDAVTQQIEAIGLRLRTLMGWVDTDNPYPR